MIAAAPGRASRPNKPDLYAAAPGCCASSTGKVWTLDPEGIAGEPAGGGGRCPTSPPTAARPNATDAFVGLPPPRTRQRTRSLTAGRSSWRFLRAAALNGRAITYCYLWCTRPHDETPATILEEHGLRLTAASVLSQVHAPVEQRGGDTAPPRGSSSSSRW